MNRGNNHGFYDTWIDIMMGEIENNKESEDEE